MSEPATIIHFPTQQRPLPFDQGFDADVIAFFGGDACQWCGEYRGENTFRPAALHYHVRLCNLCFAYAKARDLTQRLTGHQP